jgi:hypothetical protein
MKKFYTIIFTMLVFFSARAQDDQERNLGRLEAYKIAYLTKKLNLTPQEAQQFWPIYNQYQKEIRSVRSDVKSNRPDEIQLEEKMLNIRKKYNSEFSKALNPEKVNTLYKSEKEFGHMVQKELLERRQQKTDNRKRD